MTILERIQELAKKRDITLKELSLELGFSKNYLYSLKTQAPSADKLSKIADYFRVSTDYLLGRSDDKYDLSPQEKIEYGILKYLYINVLKDKVHQNCTKVYYHQK